MFFLFFSLSLSEQLTQLITLHRAQCGSFTVNTQFVEIYGLCKRDKIHFHFLEEALLCVAMYLEIGEVFFHTCSAITGF